jgi:hypothetical protein
VGRHERTVDYKGICFYPVLSIFLSFFFVLSFIRGAYPNQPMEHLQQMNNWVLLFTRGNARESKEQSVFFFKKSKEQSATVM